MFLFPSEQMHSYEVNASANVFMQQCVRAYVHNANFEQNITAESVIADPSGPAWAQGSIRNQPRRAGAVESPWTVAGPTTLNKISGPARR